VRETNVNPSEGPSAGPNPTVKKDENNPEAQVWGIGEKSKL